MRSLVMGAGAVGVSLLGPMHAFAAERASDASIARSLLALESHVDRVGTAISAAFERPSSVSPPASAAFEVTLRTDGSIVSARDLASYPSDAFARAALNAIRNAAPLVMPTDPALTGIPSTLRITVRSRTDGDGISTRVELADTATLVGRVETVFALVRETYVAVVDDAAWMGRCYAGMRRHAEAEGISDPRPSGEGKGTAVTFDDVRRYLTVIRLSSAASSSDSKGVDACLREAVAGLDKRSAYLDTEQFSDLKASDPGLGVIGLDLRLDAGRVAIVDSIPGGPAERGGVRSGDVLVKVNDVALQGVALPDVVRLLQGEAGSEVGITIERSASPQPIEIALRREVVRREPVTWKLVRPGYGYIRVSRLSDLTPRSLQKSMTAMVADHPDPLNGLVLDLRGNIGGLLESSVGVAAAFLKLRTLVVAMDHRNPKYRSRLTASPEDYERLGRQVDFAANLPPQAKSVPMVVLVDSRTGAGAEIVAAALQDHQRARIVGGRTAGAGTTQTVTRVTRNTALRLTTAHAMRPSGAPIEGTGIVPDVSLEGELQDTSIFGTDRDAALTKALGLLAAR
jgi:carboxyl-terminal processing protease